MAVDDRPKRMSTMNAVSTLIRILPNADGSMTQADRQHLLDCYSGIAAAAPQVSAPQIMVMGVG